MYTFTHIWTGELTLEAVTWGTLIVVLLDLAYVVASHWRGELCRMMKAFEAR